MQAEPSKPALRVRGRSLLAFILAPEPPLASWLGELDSRLAASPEFFLGRPVIADITALPPEDGQEAVDALRHRDIRVIDVIDPGSEGVLAGGRETGPIDLPNPLPPPPTSLLVPEPVRSGQRIVFPGGDVTIVGSVASGAEVLAGGSVHVYGALRGRAIAGAAGNAAARVFCQRMEAELIAIDGLYKTAEAIGTELRGRAAQAWLNGEALMLSPIG